MTLVIRFVDRNGFIREHIFLDIVHVKDKVALTLKENIFSILSHHNLDIRNIRVQMYHIASNMCGKWNGLQTLFIKDCLYAYYVHYLAHQLPLALIAAARKVFRVLLIWIFVLLI
jgi:hypothetical protein